MTTNGDEMTSGNDETVPITMATSDADSSSTAGIIAGNNSVPQVRMAH